MSKADRATIWVGAYGMALVTLIHARCGAPGTLIQEGELDSDAQTIADLATSTIVRRLAEFEKEKIAADQEQALRQQKRGTKS